MKIKKELIKRQVAEDTILVPVGKTVHDSNGLFVLNDLAAFIWDLLPEAQNEEAICQAVLAEYEVTPEEARADIAAFVNKLREMGIL